MARKTAKAVSLAIETLEPRRMLSGNAGGSGIRPANLGAGMLETAIAAALPASRASSGTSNVVTQHAGPGTVVVNSASGDPILGGGVSYAMSPVGGTLTITGTAGDETFTLTGNGPGAGVVVVGEETINYSDFDSLVIEALGGNDTIYVNSQSIPVTINGGDNDDVISVGTGNLDDLAPITTNGGNGADLVLINDSSATFSDTYTITDSTVSRDFWNGLTYGTLENLVLLGETGINTYNINSTDGATPLTISDSGGDDTFNVGAGSLDALGSVTIDAGGGTDGIFVKDDAVAFGDTYTITSTTLTRPFFGGLTYSNAENLVLFAQQDNNTIDVNSTSCAVSLLANGGSDTINLKETSGAGVLIYPSTGDDAVNVNTDNTGFAWAIPVGVQRIGALTVGSGGLYTFYPGGTVVTATSVSISTGGAINVYDGALIVDYTGGSPIGAIQFWLKNGYNGGAWNGLSGIHSATAQTTPGTGVGIAEATDIGSPAIFAGQSIDSTCVLLRYTLNGDANLNKTVDTVDFSILAANFSGTGKRWSKGDFNFDTTVNSVDFNLLVSKFSQSLAAPSAETSQSPFAPPSAPTGVFSSTNQISDADRGLPTDELPAQR